MGFKYTILCDTLARCGYNVFDEPREILQAIKDAGYDGADIPGTLGRMDPKELKAIVDEIGLEVPEVAGAWAYFHAGEDRDLASGNPESRERGVTYAENALDFGAVLGAKYFEICCPQPPIYQYGFPHEPIEKLRENFVEAVQEIHTHARKHGISIVLEPLNPYEALPQVLTTLSNAQKIIEMSELPDIGIQPDIYHMNISESSITDALRAVGPLIKHVHTNETNRYTLGTGHADFHGIVRTLKEVGFDGYLCIYLPLISQEVFHLGKEGYGAKQQAGSKPVPRPDLRKILKTPITYLKQIERMVEIEMEIYYQT